MKRLAIKLKAIKQVIHGRETDTPPLTAVSDQSNCPLFTRFPREIRDIIWEYTVSLRENGRAVHFHIYDDVYDCCTYSGRSTEAPGEHSELNRAAGLLRTCKSIYEEVVPLLYGQVRFELVLFSGYVRPEAESVLSTKNDLENWDPFRMGKVDRCNIFTLMKDVTITLQPTLYLDSRRYEARIASLLKALDFGQNTTQLHLKFNIPGINTGDTTAEEWAPRVVQALMPLTQYHGPQAVLAKDSKPTDLSIESSTLDRTTYPQTCKAIIELLDALGLSKILIFDAVAMMHDLQQMQSNECLLRQHYLDCCFTGQHNSQPPGQSSRPMGQRILRGVIYFFAGLALLAAGPVVVPVLGASQMVTDAIERREKGESWRMRARATQ